MDARADTRYRDQTRRLVTRRGPFCFAIFLIGVGCAGGLEVFYHPERFMALLGVTMLELGICVVAVRLYRVPRLADWAVDTTLVTAILLVACVTLYFARTAGDGTALAFVVLGVVLTTALMLPWGGRRQAVFAVASAALYGVHLGVAMPAAPTSALPTAYGVFGVLFAGALSVVGAALLDRQRWTIFAQRERLARHVAACRDMTQAFHGFDPLRAFLVTCVNTLQALPLRRLWAVWRSPVAGDAQAYFARHDGEGIQFEALAAPERLWADLAPWGERGESFIAEPGDGRVPASLRSATAGGMLCVPIRFEGEALGALCADDGGRPLALDAQDLALANVLGAGVGIGMANARLHCQVTAASEEKSTFLARIAHELRNPLHTIIWDLDSLRAEAQSPHASLERLRQNALLMVTAAEELQQFSEVETHRVTPQPTTVDLVSLLDGVRATAAALLDDRPISLAVTVASDVGLIRSDPLRLRQILGNLLANAAKYTERGAIAVEVFRVGASVTIEVSDTGVGITPEEQESIFRPFYRGSTGAIVSARGMGLGLSIAQELAVLLGGRIAVESVAGVGSTFRFVLPALRVTPALGAPSGTADDLESDAAAAPAEAPAGSAPPEALLAGRVVLLIEDDPMERVRAAALARHCGARVIQATDGFEGLRRAREHRPDIIVLDLGLPGLSGVDVLGRLLRDPQLTGVNVLVATGHVDARLELHCRTVGCAGYLVKPYSREDLLGALARGAASGVRRMQASAG